MPLPSVLNNVPQYWYCSTDYPPQALGQAATPLSHWPATRASALLASTVKAETPTPGRDVRYEARSAEKENATHVLAAICNKPVVVVVEKMPPLKEDNNKEEDNGDDDDVDNCSSSGQERMILIIAAREKGIIGVVQAWMGHKVTFVTPP